MADDEQGRFRGGKQNERDRWFGLKGRPGFREFKRWLHRKGSFDHTDGLDIESREQAHEVWEEWQRLGRPTAKWSGD